MFLTVLVRFYSRSCEGIFIGFSIIFACLLILGIFAINIVFKRESGLMLALIYLTYDIFFDSKIYSSNFKFSHMSKDKSFGMTWSK